MPPAANTKTRATQAATAAQRGIQRRAGILFGSAFRPLDRSCDWTSCLTRALNSGLGSDGRGRLSGSQPPPAAEARARAPAPDSAASTAPRSRPGAAAQCTHSVCHQNGWPSGFLTLSSTLFSRPLGGSPDQGCHQDPSLHKLSSSLFYCSSMYQALLVSVR